MPLEEFDDIDFDTMPIDDLPYQEESMTPRQRLAADGWVQMIPPLEGAFWRKGKICLNAMLEEIPMPEALKSGGINPFGNSGDDGRKPIDDTIVAPAEGSKTAELAKPIAVGSKQADRNHISGSADGRQDTLSLGGTPETRSKKGPPADKKSNGNGQT